MLNSLCDYDYDLTGIENTTTSACVTVRQNVSPPELESDDYPTPNPTDE